MNTPGQNLNISDEQLEEKIKNDLAHLYNYPSIGKLFSTPELNNLQTIRTKLNDTRQRLDTIVRRGSNEEANKASKALEAITITLNFLQNLEEERQKNNQ